MTTQADKDSFAINVLGAPPSLFGEPPPGAAAGQAEAASASAQTASTSTQATAASEAGATATPADAGASSGGAMNAPSEAVTNAPANATAGAPTDAPSGDTGAEGAALVDSPTFRRLVEAMEADSDEFGRLWKTQSADSVFQLVPDHIHAEYDADGVACDKAQLEFNGEWNQIVFGKGDPKRLLAAYDIFSLRIGALEQSNARIGALIAIDLAKRLQFFITLVIALSKASMAYAMSERLKKLAARLQKAADDVTDAKIKMGLNIAASVITMVIAPEATLGKIALGVGAVTVHIVIDESLGKGSATGKVVFVGGESQEAVEAVSEHAKDAIENLGKVGKKSFGTAGMAVTALLDYKEVGEAKEIVEKLKADIDTEQSAYDSLMAGVTPLLPQFIAADIALRTIEDEIRKALGAMDDAAKNYDAIKQEIQKVIAEGS